jgi:hypothetical protein
MRSSKTHLALTTSRTLIAPRWRPCISRGTGKHVVAMNPMATRNHEKRNAGEVFLIGMHTNLPNTSLNWDSVRFLLFQKGPSACLQRFWEFEESERGMLWPNWEKYHHNISEHQSRMDFCEISWCWEGIVNVLTCSIRYGSHTFIKDEDPGYMIMDSSSATCTTE